MCGRNEVVLLGYSYKNSDNLQLLHKHQNNKIYNHAILLKIIKKYTTNHSEMAARKYTFHFEANKGYILYDVAQLFLRSLFSVSV